MSFLRDVTPKAEASVDWFLRGTVDTAEDGWGSMEEVDVSGDWCRLGQLLDRWATVVDVEINLRRRGGLLGEMEVATIEVEGTGSRWGWEACVREK